MNNSIFQKKLLLWYKAHARDLPWRRTNDPYKIWVSEIMLQQTQVDTVIPYYEKWIKRFPTLKSLAQAPQADVLKHWAGLGYYRRARMIHEAAKGLEKNSAGKIPSTAEELNKLPGVGRYTAGAIASIAFKQKASVLDGNVIRVLTRLYAIRKDVGLPKTIQELWKLADSLVPASNPGDFNQAMMELGAMVCLPDNPACLLCPVSGFCSARKLGRETLFPVKARKEKIEKKKTAALILRNNGKVLIQKQSEKDRWGGLWTFPFWQDFKTMLKTVGVSTKDLKHTLSINHGFTKYNIRLDVYEYVLSSAGPVAGVSPKFRRKNSRIRQGISSPIKNHNFSTTSTQPISEIWPLRKSFLLKFGDAPHQRHPQKQKAISVVRRDVASPISNGIGNWRLRRGRAAQTGSYLDPNDPAGQTEMAFRSEKDIVRRWVKVKELEKFAFPSPHQKIVKELMTNDR